MFKKYKMWYRYSPKRDDSDLDYGAGKARKAKRKQARPSRAPSRLASAPGSAAPSRLPSPVPPPLSTAARPAPEMVAAAAMDKQRVDEMKEMEFSQCPLDAGAEFPPGLQYEFYLVAGRQSHYGAPVLSWGRYCVFISAGLIAVTLATVLMTLYVATVLTIPYDEEETYTATDGHEVSFGTVFPIYRETSTPHSAQLADSLRKERGYAGVILRWPETASVKSWKRMPKLLAWLQKTLSQSVGLKLGVALRQDAMGPDFTQLASSLGPVSLFLLPPDMPASKYRGQTIRYFSESTLIQLRQLYTKYFAPGGANGSALAKSVCYLLPADAYTFKVSPRSDSTPRPVEQSLGPGVEGNVTRVAGRMAYFESCQFAPASSTLTLRYGLVATQQDNWVSYTEPPQLANFLDSLHDNLSATCTGLWNPQFDDFGQLCSYQTYPLASTVFRHYNDTH